MSDELCDTSASNIDPSHRRFVPRGTRASSQGQQRVADLGVIYPYQGPSARCFDGHIPRLLR